MHRVEEVHAAEVFRLLQGFRQAGDGNGGGVGREHRVVTQHFFGFRQHGLLDLRVLDHRLDDHVDVGEVAVAQGGANHGQGLAHFGGVHLAFADALGEQLGGFVHAQVQGVRLDVLHHDGGAFQGGLEGDAAAHDARAQYRRVLDLAAGLGGLAVHFLNLLVGQEQTHHGGGLWGLGDLGEAFGLHVQRFVALHAGGLLHRLHRFHGRRVVLAGLLLDHGGTGLERHHLLHRGHRQGLQLFLALGAEVDLAGQALLHQVDGGVTHVVVLDHRVHHAVLEGFFRLVLAAGGDPLNGVVHAHQARRAHGAAETGVDAQLHFREAHLGLFAHNAEFAGQAHLQAAAQGEAVDGGHFRHVQVFEGVEHFVRLAGPFGDLRFFLGEHFGEFGDVRANDEHVFRGGDDDAFHLVVAFEGLGGLAQVFQGGTVELVHGLALKVELQFGDPVVKQLYAYGVALVNHIVCSPVPKYAAGQPPW